MLANNPLEGQQPREGFTHRKYPVKGNHRIAEEEKAGKARRIRLNSAESGETVWRGSAEGRDRQRWTIQATTAHFISDKSADYYKLSQKCISGELAPPNPHYSQRSECVETSNTLEPNPKLGAGVFNSCRDGRRGLERGAPRHRGRAPRKTGLQLILRLLVKRNGGAKFFLLWRAPQRHRSRPRPQACPKPRNQCRSAGKPAPAPSSSRNRASSPRAAGIFFP